MLFHVLYPCSVALLTEAINVPTISTSFCSRYHAVCGAHTACAGNVEAEVDRSLVYCLRHSIADDDHTPCHKRPVFHPDLVQRWHEAYADKFPELASSTELARKVCGSLLPASCTSGGSHVGLFACSRCPWIDSCCVGPRFTCACP